MKYQDSLQQASDKAAQVKLFLHRAGLAAHPVNYAVCYEYISGNNAQLCQIIEQKLAAKAPLDDFVMADLYSRFMAEDNAQQQLMLQDAAGMVSRIAGYTDVAAEQLDDYLQQLDDSMLRLEQVSNDSVVLTVVNQLHQTTADFKRDQQQLHQQLLLANQQSHQLRHELEQLKQQRLLDPLTGLYNRAAMQNQLDVWFSEEPNRRIAAIVVNLDHFSRFNQQYGNTIGDVILAKVARKVSSYVQNSGLPVRSGGEEFLILLPDVDLRSASEIAEQVRRGVEKLRFVSSRSKQTLPKVTISLGVSLYQQSENWYQFLGRTAEVLLLAKQRGRNQVASEAMLAT
ncbi:GGDEF domain-containing protein [Rheinheimera baltica]|uniref:diguanylate cyclase n=1 Tax=Rheinheimera baltica TaxID=67576 RepID=A0ABT9I088_9GAMM|nr:GGDEF domain-containing protein [Rheinheimera baltica]MDP5136807.1 GGDEF domain-containing protein [Rheinheimera baltica]MDP5142247.1 GGDEF domain-containing protein [Rheinheimera baltica]MDP5150847.1 GGDEF domain-containing protein [Rheinheimera baltica]MDP5188618.1 GGDEF domain-containing protein [Rheinheimera baltica]